MKDNKKKQDGGEPYKPLVPIKDLEDFRSGGEPDVVGDRRDGKLYRYTPPIKLRVNVALATGRPLLVMGPSGCGKSSLAFNLARVMRRRYYEFVVTSRSQARDLFYRFDAVRRLGDAHAAKGPAGSDDDDRDQTPWQTQYPYIEPGPLWWIFNRESAQRRGFEGTPEFPAAVDPAVWQPAGVKDAGAVLLIDEVDKAEPDFPNNLLVPLGSHKFILEEVARPVELRAPGGATAADQTPLVIITSNRERELPDAFVRRCVVLEIPAPTPDDLVAVAAAVTGSKDEGSFRSIARKMFEATGQQEISTAEFLDTIRAVAKLSASEPALADIVKSTTWRQREG